MGAPPAREQWCQLTDQCRDILHGAPHKHEIDVPAVVDKLVPQTGCEQDRPYLDIHGRDHIDCVLSQSHARWYAASRGKKT